jgi:hypothetical protein
MTTKQNQAHTFIVVGTTDSIAVIAGMLLSLGTSGARAPKPGRPNRDSGDNTIQFDEQGKPDGTGKTVTVVWRKRDGWAVSFRETGEGHASPETDEYRSAWDAAVAIELGYHPGQAAACSGLTPAPEED